MLQHNNLLLNMRIHSSRIARKTALVISFLLLSACASNPKVHLYFDGNSQEQKHSLITQLKNNKFDVHQSHTPPPDIPQGNYIVYTPEDKSAHWISSINSTLSQLGMKEANVVPFKIGSGISSHQYTAGNIGLYILNKDSKSQDARDIPIADTQNQIDLTREQLGSKSCGKLKLMEFYEDGNVIVVDEESDKMIFKGKWVLTGNELSIKKGLSLQKFNVGSETLAFKQDAFSAINLNPKKINEKSFNCVYSTYFIDGLYKI